MKVIGICGTNGSGKGTVAEYLLGKENLKGKLVYVKARDLIIERATKAGVNLNDRTDFINFTEKLYADGGSLWSDLLSNTADDGKIYILESIRRVREINNIREFATDSLIISVDSTPEIRYERISKRNTQTDHVSFEKFLSEEEKESQGTIDTVMNIPKCIDLSDVKLTNNGDLDKFKLDIENQVLTNKIFQL